MPPPGRRGLAPANGLPNTRVRVPTTTSTDAIRAAYNIIVANDLTPTATQIPRLRFFINGELVLVYWSNEAAVVVNQRSRNLIQFSALERVLRGDTVLRYVPSPTSWRTYFYHSQVRQALWEYMTADEEYNIPCIPCSNADLNAGAIRHCTPTRRSGDRANEVCARCVYSQHPNRCMWPGDLAPTPYPPNDPNRNRGQRPIQQLLALQAASPTLSTISSLSPVPTSPSPRGLLPPPRGAVTSPAARGPVASPMSGIDDVMSRMSISPAPMGGSRDATFEAISNLNFRRNFVVNATNHYDAAVRQHLATVWNTERYEMLWRLTGHNQAFRDAVAPYIMFGGPPDTSQAPDPRLRPVGLPLDHQFPGLARPPTPPKYGGTDIPQDQARQIDRSNSRGPTQSGAGGGAPRPSTGPRTGTGTRTVSEISAYFQLDPNNLPPVTLAPTINPTDVIRVQHAQIPADASQLMSTLLSEYISRHIGDPNRTVPTANADFRWQRMHVPMFLDANGDINRVNWSRIEGRPGWYTIREFRWVDRAQRWERTRPDYVMDQRSRDQAWLWDMQG